MRYAYILFFVLASFAATIQAQSAGTSEVFLGLGAAFPRESSPLNIAGENGMPASLIGNLGYRKYVGDLAAVGIRAFGTVNTLSDYQMTSTGNPVPHKTEFTLTTYHIGLEGLLLLADEGHVIPYVSVLVLYSGGLLTNKELGNLQLQGFSLGVGLGMRIEATKSTFISVEGSACFGSAKWKKKPFSNSSSDRYNPSAFLLTSSVWFSFK